MSSGAADARNGSALGAIGGLVISFDIPMIRLAGSDPWITLTVRGACMALALTLVWLLLRKPGRTTPLADTDFITVGVLYGASTFFFTLAIYTTTTANLVFILAFMSMIAALLAWVLVGERPRPATWTAIAVTISGVAIIVSDGIEAGGRIGDLYALCAASLLALALVVTRKSGKDMSLAPGLGGLVTLVLGIAFLGQSAGWPQAPFWLLLNGLVVIPLATYCLALAPRFIPAPHAAMFYLIETVLAPVWVWIIFNETISPATLVGGSLVIGAVTVHSLWNIHRPLVRPVA